MQYVSSIERIGMEKGMEKILGSLIATKFKVSSDSVGSFSRG